MYFVRLSFATRCRTNVSIILFLKQFFLSVNIQGPLISNPIVSMRRYLFLTRTLGIQRTRGVPAPRLFSL